MGAFTRLDSNHHPSNNLKERFLYKKSEIYDFMGHLRLQIMNVGIIKNRDF